LRRWPEWAAGRCRELVAGRVVAGSQGGCVRRHRRQKTAAQDSQNDQAVISRSSCGVGLSRWSCGCHRSPEAAGLAEGDGRRDNWAASAANTDIDRHFRHRPDSAQDHVITTEIHGRATSRLQPRTGSGTYTGHQQRDGGNGVRLITDASRWSEQVRSSCCRSAYAPPVRFGIMLHRPQPRSRRQKELQDCQPQPETAMAAMTVPRTAIQCAQLRVG
jgi:hypothetical protein